MLSHRDQAAELRLQAAVNRHYAEANEDTFARTNGQLGSLYMAEVHRACADRKEAQAQQLEAETGS